MGKEDLPTKNNDDLETDDLDIFLTELAEYYSDYVMQPGEFTVNDIMERSRTKNTKADRSRVTSDLHRRAKNGELGEKKVRLDGSQQWVFWRIKNPAG